MALAGGVCPKLKVVVPLFGVLSYDALQFGNIGCKELCCLLLSGSLFVIMQRGDKDFVSLGLGLHHIDGEDIERT